ncbi:hypothetical protein D3C77_489550 [compost metagenome]
MADIAVEISGFLRADTHCLTGFELNSYPATEHQGKLLTWVANEFVELLPLTRNDPRKHRCHQALGKLAGNQVIVIGSGAVTRHGR